MSGLFQSVTYDKLFDLIGNRLPPPLGLAGTDVNYLDLSRFVKKVLLCMPADQKRCDDLSKPGKNYLGRVLFPASTVPSDIRVINEQWNPAEIKNQQGQKNRGFTFRQVIIAVHKRFLFDFELEDELAFEAARVVHKARLNDLTLYLSRLTLYRSDPVDVPFKSMLLMQRISPLTYRDHFMRIMKHEVHILRLKVHVFGFKPFDAFIVNTLR
jgi:hypothetical protein